MANPNSSKYNYLLENNAKYMNLTALSFGERKVTFEELHDRIEKYTKILYAKGIREGDVIGVMALNTPESVYLLYALDNVIGAITVGLNPLDNAEKVRADIEKVKPKMVISVDTFYQNIKKSEKALNFSTILYSPLESLVTAIPGEMVQFIPRYHISLYSENIDLKDLEEKIYYLVSTKLGDNWLPGSIVYYDKPLERMSNSKINLAYYVEEDKKALAHGTLNNDGVKLSLMKRI